ncbi:hypothetical protein B0H15DRAFT_811091 [Mycena belliarum]|uniref:Uncharacterized protein n=1 Tax=Mycena belliarum TaxID=1033014 RepID=A0AAD6ULK3_9AGAR|nr:hypothetical protein B0H15DRAFT_811091 [Mycena belliae]
MHNRRDTLSKSRSFSPSSSPPQICKKRKRQPSECDEAQPMAGTNDGRMKPRRIDPDRLAIRLGPELVGEMDAHIVPGAKMPSFQIRQAFVAKYNVDRRHIYDYFHSRGMRRILARTNLSAHLGLRVAKEDKHLNLSHRLSRKPGAARKPAPPPKALKLALSLKPADSQVPPSDDLTPKTISDVTGPFTLESQRKPVIANPSNSSMRNTAPLRPPPPQQISLLPSFQPRDLSSDSSSSEDGDSFMSSTFDSMDTLTESSSFGEDLELLSLGYPASERLSESFDLELSPLECIEHAAFEINESLPDIPGFTRNVPFPLDDLSSLLSQTERMEFYDLVNDSLPPFQGIEESAGTYKAHMERLSFNRWGPRSHYHYGDAPLSQPPVVQSEPCQISQIITILEKENIDPSAPNPSIQPPNNYRYPQTAGPSSLAHDRSSHRGPISHRREHPATPLQPASINRLMSPIIPSVSDPHQLLHAANPGSNDSQPPERPTPLVWTTPMQSSQPVSFRMRTQEWQKQMSDVFATANYPYSAQGCYHTDFRRG